VKQPPEPIAVLLALAAVAVAIWVTYARLAPSELYNVSGTGFWAGASRALVFINFPAALVGVALAAIAADSLAGHAAAGAAMAAVALCAVVVWPGVVEQSNLDAKTVNALPAAGVGLAAVLTLTARSGLRTPSPSAGDAVRLIVGVALVLGAVPWIAADLGFSFNGVPVLGTLYQTGELRHEPGRAGLHTAVHRGHHHGLDGVLLALAALLLSRRLAAVSKPAVRAAVSLYLSLMLVYGIANALQDFWLEQVVKRGWTGTTLPNVLHPDVSWGWAAIAAGALAVWLGWFRRERAVA
jgi:hypothetical protein